MSSNYLTSENMNMIGRLLAEIRPRSSRPDADRETATARFLVESFQGGTKTIDGLRRRLESHASQHSVNRWDDKDGTVGKPPAPERLMLWSVASKPLKPRHDEADRQHVSDTVGTRRRARDIHERNRLI